MLLHEGGFQPTRSALNDCNGLTGPIIDIVNRTTQAVDLFITGHTHQPYNCVIDGRPVTSATSFGRAGHRHRPDARPPHQATSPQVAANNVIVDTARARRRHRALIDAYQELAAPLANRVIGRSPPTPRARRRATGEYPPAT